MEENKTAEEASTSLLDSMLGSFLDEQSWIFMAAIALCFGVGIAIFLERLLQLLRYDKADAPSFFSTAIKHHVTRNEVQEAIQACSNTSAILAFVLKAGLKRANQSKSHIQQAVEAAYLEVVPKVEKRLNYLALTANISTLLGLLGTIAGMIYSFGSLTQADAADKAAELAVGISTAMNTTFAGLVSAITLMVLHTYLTNKSNKIVSESEEYGVKLIDLLSAKKGSDAA